jgi:hypothetical protein
MNTQTRLDPAELLRVEAIALADRLTATTMTALRQQQMPAPAALHACEAVIGKLLVFLEPEDREQWVDEFVAALRASVKRLNDLDARSTH